MKKTNKVICIDADLCESIGEKKINFSKLVNDFLREYLYKAETSSTEQIQSLQNEAEKLITKASSLTQVQEELLIALKENDRILLEKEKKEDEEWLLREKLYNFMNEHREEFNEGYPIKWKNYEEFYNIKNAN